MNNEDNKQYDYTPEEQAIMDRVDELKKILPTQGIKTNLFYKLENCLTPEHKEYHTLLKEKKKINSRFSNKQAMLDRHARDRQLELLTDKSAIVDNAAASFLAQNPDAVEKLLGKLFDIGMHSKVEMSSIRALEQFSKLTKLQASTQNKDTNAMSEDELKEKLKANNLKVEEIKDVSEMTPEEAEEELKQMEKDNEQR